MVQETVAHVQTAPWFAFQVTAFIFSQDIHFNKQSQHFLFNNGNKCNWSQLDVSSADRKLISEG